MARPLLSANWYRVKDLRPRLRRHAEVHRQSFRGEIWYVIEDHAAASYQRVSQAGYRLVGMMDGKRTVDQIWRSAAETLGDDLPTQDETIQLLMRLHAAEILHVDIPADMTRVTERGQNLRRKKAMQSIRNPLALRIPIFDPDRFLRATMWFMRPLTGWLGAILWLGIVAFGVSLAALHWESLSHNVADRAFTVGNLLLALATYPLIKACHELGHAYAVRRWGGEVHEIGVMFLVFMPVPYVDASAATAFRSKWRRAAVAAAGILVEMFLAAVAMILWTMLEPGLLRAAMMNVILVAGISTLLFNGNPLLRFDGYYVFSDLIEIPNLGSRANHHLIYLAQRYLFGLDDVKSPAVAPGEAFWFVTYGIAALLYRMVIMFGIVLFVASRFFEVGLALALWSFVLVIVMPVLKGLWFVLTSPRLDRRRAHAILVTATIALAFGWLLFSRPAPYASIVEGVVWPPEHTYANAGSDGFVTEMLARPGETLAPGAAILRIADPLLDARVELLQARVKEMSLRRLAVAPEDRAALDIASQELGLAQQELALATDLRGEQILKSPGGGRLAFVTAEELEGRFVHKGQTLAYVVGRDDPVIRVAVPQSTVDLVTRRLAGIELRLASDLGTTHPARILRAVPQATTRLPSAALAVSGGGRIAADPTQTGAHSIEPLFLFDIAPQDQVQLSHLGERVYIRFDYARMPIGQQIWRAMRQIFLRDLNV